MVAAPVSSSTQIRCPHCGWVHGEALEGATGQMRFRCHNRFCRKWFTVRLDVIWVHPLDVRTRNP